MMTFYSNYRQDTTISSKIYTWRGIGSEFRKEGVAEMVDVQQFGV